METLSKDVIGLIFNHMTPTDWLCSALVCKAWYPEISKWMKMRKIQFIKRLREEVELFGIDNINMHKTNLCIRPIYYLSPIGTGCKGHITNYLCAQHRCLSNSNKEICDNCLKAPSHSNCFENRCDSMKCRDYLYVLRNGRAEKVKGYPCAYNGCDKLSDADNGFCFRHAMNDLGTVDYFNIDGKEKEETEEVVAKFRCIAMNKGKGKNKETTRCSNMCSSRIGKCHVHMGCPANLI